MNLNLKILLPLILLLALFLSFFVFFLLRPYAETNLLLDSLERNRLTNQYSRQLFSIQAEIRREVRLYYYGARDQTNLDRISVLDNETATILNSLFDLLGSGEEEKIFSSILEKRRASQMLRQQTIQEIQFLERGVLPPAAEAWSAAEEEYAVALTTLVSYYDRPLGENLARLATTNRELNDLSLLFIVISAVMLFLSSIYYRTIVISPLNTLTQTIEEISRGKLRVEIEPKLRKSSDEIGRLSRAFERTMVSLKLALKKSAPEQVKKP